MKDGRTRRWGCLPLCLAALPVLAGCEAQEQAATEETEEQEPTHQAAEVSWSYGGDTGPAHWGTLAQAFVACETSREQSPVDLTAVRTSDIPDLVFQYEPTPLGVVHTGHTIKVQVGEGSTMAVGEERYTLLQFHLHSPSEHTSEGRSFPVSLHLLHADRTGNLAAVAVLIEEGAANESYAPLLENLPMQAGEQRTTETTINAADLLPTSLQYVRYDGSLTTPPCTEGVRWHVLMEPVTLSAAQIEAIAALIPNTNRPVQALNERELVLDASPGG